MTSSLDIVVLQRDGYVEINTEENSEIKAFDSMLHLKNASKIKLSNCHNEISIIALQLKDRAIKQIPIKQKLVESILLLFFSCFGYESTEMKIKRVYFSIIDKNEDRSYEIVKPDYFDVVFYAQKIERLVTEKPNTTKELIKQKSDKILKKVGQVINIKCQFNDYVSIFQKTIDQALLELSMLKPGRKLLKRVLKSPFKIEVRVLDLIRCACITYDDNLDFNTGKFYTSKAFLSIPIDHLSKDKFNRLTPNECPFAVTLAHELIHLIHYIEEDAWAVRIRSATKSNLFNQSFDDLEEQLTICGLKSSDGEVDLCENVFLKAFGYQFRTSHKSTKYSQLV